MSDLVYISASEVARFAFCGRALAYDYLAKPTRWQFALPMLVSAVLAFFLYLWIISDAILILASWLGGVFLFTVMRSLWGRLSQPTNLMVYHHKRAWRNRKTMVAKQFGLSGKPDYLLPVEDGFIPVLTKNNPAPEHPYQAHILQIIAYCLLVAENTPRHPTFGIIRYGDGRTFEVDFDEDAVEVLSQIMDQIEKVRRSSTPIPITHADRARCYACKHRKNCPESLF